jgi:hypothetical protein
VAQHIAAATGKFQTPMKVGSSWRSFLVAFYFLGNLISAVTLTIRIQLFAEVMSQSVGTTGGLARR